MRSPSTIQVLVQGIRKPIQTFRLKTTHYKVMKAKNQEVVDGVGSQTNAEQDDEVFGETEQSGVSQKSEVTDAELNAVQTDEMSIVPLDDTPSSEVTVQGYTFTGSGISASDFPVVQVNGYNVVSINTNKPLTVKTNGTATVGLYVPRGNTANLTFAGVNITAPWTIDLQSGNVANHPFTSARTGATVNYVAPGSGGTLNLIVADGTTNTIESTAAATKQYAAGIHVGSGSKFTVDDGTPNVDTSGNAIVPVNGKIASRYVIQEWKGRSCHCQ